MDNSNQIGQIWDKRVLTSCAFLYTIDVAAGRKFHYLCSLPNVLCVLAGTPNDDRSETPVESLLPAIRERKRCRYRI